MGLAHGTIRIGIEHQCGESTLSRSALSYGMSGTACAAELQKRCHGETCPGAA
jgi:hypothetical protein